MLRSMTGHGQAQAEADGFHVTAEVRSVNNRFLKLSIRGLEGFTYLEPKLEALVRETVKRGSVNVTLRIANPETAAAHRINVDALKSYRDQLSKAGGPVTPIPTEALLQLPGVVVEEEQYDSAGDPWHAVQSALRVAIEHFESMRAVEGEAMLTDFQRNCDGIETCAKEIARRAPAVVSAYEERLTDRINRLLEPHSTSVQPSDIAREVGVFAERSDISEELVRLESHIAQFRGNLEKQEPTGKKLEFVIQEMFREVNTIGSKANDSEISTHVIEAKTLIERMREMVQNVE